MGGVGRLACQGYHVLRALIGVLGKHVVEAPGQLVLAYLLDVFIAADASTWVRDLDLKAQTFGLFVMTF